ncbi:MAG: hypothetical protein K2F75_00155 [Paramuribaculum sp.]|nr:hypothetical protein [Paramuribaculum sp.]
MKRVFLSLMVFMMSSVMAVQVVDAQTRPGRGQSTSSTSRPSGGSRPGNGGQSHNNNNSRPGNNNGSRPGNNNNNNNNNHNNRPGAGARPGAGVRPGTSPSRPSAPAKPTAPSRPGHTVAPARPVRPTISPVRPGAVARPPVMAPPVRPTRPVITVWNRPQPPRSWRPTYTFNVVPGILGLSFGVNLSSALDYFYNSGYTVDGYGTQEVYLRNVGELGYTWDDATLYFDGGGLVRSQYFDSSVGYNNSRYNALFNKLTAQFGRPVNYSNSSGNLTATWFGYNGDYVTLQYTLMNSGSGYRYFTILTYGN